MQRFLALFFLLFVAFAPLGLRLSGHSAQWLGLYSDLLSGLSFFLLAWACPKGPRFFLIVLWGLFQLGAHELHFALQRYPVWQDLHYLIEAGFLKNSVSSLHFSAPYFTAFLFAGVLLALLVPIRNRLKLQWFFGLALIVAALFYGHYRLLWQGPENQQIQACYNPLHWFTLDALANRPWKEQDKMVALPPGLCELDLQGTPLLTQKGQAKNVLIVVMEGIPGLYNPDISAAMGIAKADISMPRLASATKKAMHAPDFSTHNHQTIRGLYALLCGDFSKFSWDTPKAFDLQSQPERAAMCLPAQMKKNGFSTHYLQAAGLGFMSKDRFMPLVGFEEVHGLEWFSEENPFPFEWGKVDSVFFAGARRYIESLQKKKQPWMLTLLTVGTHQPYAVPDELAENYGSRKAAAVSLLDEALGEFLEGLQRDGMLNDTLVLITSDESHGSERAPWICSWGTAMVLAPEEAQLPGLKKGGYGLVDVEVSLLDYFGLPMPAGIVGRSLFRDYQKPREMLSSTASVLRWHTEDNMRHECTVDGRCRSVQAGSILGEPQKPFARAPRKLASQMNAMARALDSNLQQSNQEQLLRFGAGERRSIRKTKGNDWSDNLVGAQYLRFPAHSTVEVRMRVQVVQAPPEGLQLRLLVKEWEQNQKDVPLPQLPILHEGESFEKSFSFKNSRERRSFSFYLLANQVDALLQIDQFDVVISPGIK